MDADSTGLKRIDYTVIDFSLNWSLNFRLETSLVYAITVSKFKRYTMNGCPPMHWPNRYPSLFVGAT